MTEKTEAQLRKEAAERERLHIQEQERWFDSDEYRNARAAWIKSTEFLILEFEQSLYFRNARLAYRRRVNGSPDSETT